MESLANTRVWVAGHGGMVGSALVRRLASERCEILTAERKVDLRGSEQVRSWMARHRPDVVLVAAARVGGILANSTQPAEFIYDNLMIAANLVREAHRCGAKKLLFLGSSCIYPKLAPQPIPEDALLTGPLEPTNEWYAVAKIAGIKLCQAFRQQYGCNFISVMPTNLYGPGDNYDLKSGHVLPALIRKIDDAARGKKSHVEIWGSGTPLREFMYVDDLADACVFLLKNYSDAEHINAGSGVEVSIHDLARKIAEIVGYTGKFTFDTSKPDGTPRKFLDSEKLRKLGWRPKTSLEQGLRLTYESYLATPRTNLSLSS